MHDSRANSVQIKAPLPSSTSSGGGGENDERVKNLHDILVFDKMRRAETNREAVHRLGWRKGQLHSFLQHQEHPEIEKGENCDNCRLLVSRRSNPKVP